MFDTYGPTASFGSSGLDKRMVAVLFAVGNVVNKGLKNLVRLKSLQLTAPDGEYASHPSIQAPRLRPSPTRGLKLFIQGQRYLRIGGKAKLMTEIFLRLVMRRQRTRVLKHTSRQILAAEAL